MGGGGVDGRGPGGLTCNNNGISKVVMFVNGSPRQDCVSETLNSLHFATKVCDVGRCGIQIQKKGVCKRRDGTIERDLENFESF